MEKDLAMATTIDEKFDKKDEFQMNEEHPASVLLKDVTDVEVMVCV